MSKHLLVIGIVVFGLAAGCQKPTAVQLTADSQLVIENVTEPDPMIERPPVDSTGLLPVDGERFAGFIGVTSIKTDLGSGVEARTMARVLFESRYRPLIVDGRKWFFGLPLGTVIVSSGGVGDVLFPRERRFGMQSCGVEYVREALNYIPRGFYRITATGSDSVGAFITTVEAPELLTVLSPHGGQRIRRDADLELRWRGNGPLSIILSAAETRNGRHHLIPLFTVKPAVNDGRAVLSRRVLQGLPAGRYMFTFVLKNRDEQLTVGRFQGRVLVQASSIYNVRIDLF